MLGPTQACLCGMGALLPLFSHNDYTFIPNRMDGGDDFDCQFSKQFCSFVKAGGLRITSPDVYEMRATHAQAVFLKRTDWPVGRGM